MKKVAVIGAGHVGGATAMRIAALGLCDVVLVDVMPNVARAKAYDMEDARYALGRDCRIEGAETLSAMDGADIVVVTAGLPRKPGMTREDLLFKNADIMSQVVQGILTHAASSIVIVVSNPLDLMTYFAYRKTGFPRQRVFGMGSSLDSSRFANLIAKKMSVGIKDIRALVIGSHGETMLPMPRLTTVKGKPLTEVLPKAEVDALVQATKQRGAEIVALYGSGSAYFAPSAAICEIVETIVSGRVKEIPVCAVIDGEFGLCDVAVGVPAKIGPHGLEEIVVLDLTPEEKSALLQSAQSLKDSLKLLKV